MDGLGSSDPRRVGGFELLGRLGSGGMGEVFLGRSQRGTLAAVKLIHPDLADAPGFHDRFLREVAVARRVSGPHTAPVLDAGEEPRPWLATEYLRGVPLSDAVAQHGHLRADRTRHLGAAIAEALGAVHEAGVVHRDLKPANIMLTGEGPRVIDFGIARATGLATLTGDDTMPGSLPYMAPEQFGEDPVSPATDVFALGGVLTFCLTGEPPFGTEPWRALPDRIQHDRPRLAGVSDPSLSQVIEACLAKDPEQRPGIEQIARDLAPASTPPAGPWPPGPAPGIVTGLTRRRLLRASGAAAALGVGGAGGWLLGSGSPQTPPVPWSQRFTGVRPDEFGPVAGGRLFLLEKTFAAEPARRGGPLPAMTCALRCLDAATGRTVWRTAIEPFYWGGLPLVTGSDIWLRGRQAIHNLDPSTGTMRWREERVSYGLARRVALGHGLAYDNGELKGTPGTCEVRAYAPDSGRVVWARPIQGTVDSNATLVGDVLYVSVGTGSGKTRRAEVHALNALTGRPLWRQALQGWPGVRIQNVTTPVHADGAVIVAVDGLTLHALDAATGRPRWQIRIKTGEPAPYSVGIPHAVAGRVLLGTGDGLLRAFSTRDGAAQWTFATGAAQRRLTLDPGYLAPVAHRGLLFVRGDDTVHAIGAADGRARWSHPSDPRAGLPVVVDGTVWIPGRWAVTAHDPRDGALRERLDLRPHGLAPSTLVAGPGAVYVLAGTDTVLRLG